MSRYLLFAFGIAVGLLAHSAIPQPTTDPEVICESGEQEMIWEDYTLWVSPCKFSDTGESITVRMID